MSKQLYRVKQENSLSIMQEDNNKSFFQLKSVHWWFSDVIIQFSSFPIVSVQSVKRPQISKPNATAASTQNSIGDRNWVENLGRNQAQSGEAVPLWPDETSMVWFNSRLQHRSDWAEDSSGSCGLVPMANDHRRGSVSGAHLADMVSAYIHGCRGRL